MGAMMYSAKMGKAMPLFVLVVILAVAVIAEDENLDTRGRVKRGFSNSGFGGDGVYGRGSGERDASVSGEEGGCSDENSRGYSGSRELAFNKDSRLPIDNQRGGRSFSKSSASASASATAFNQNQKAAV